MTEAELDQFAAEHVIGLLGGPDEAEALRMIADDAAFASCVANWRTRMAELDETAPVIEPGPALWDRIEDSLVRTSTVAKASPAVAAPRRDWRRIWDDLAFWRPVGLAGAFAALLLAVGLGLSVREGQRKPVLVAVMLNDAGQPAGIVNVRADGHADLVPLRDIAVPDGRVLQVWTLWDRARGPVSLGTMAGARNISLSLDALPRTTPDQIFEITLEPAGGSPTGRPTGPVLMKGTASTAL